MLRFREYVVETFVPRDMTNLDAELDSLEKQKQEAGEVFIDWSKRKVKLLKSDNGTITIDASVYKRNPWSSGLQFFKDGVNIGEFHFFLKPIFAGENKLYGPYDFDDAELLFRFKKFEGCKIVYDDNVKRLIHNMCKLVYYHIDHDGVKKALDLSEIVYKEAIKRNFLIIP